MAHMPGAPLHRRRIAATLALLLALIASAGCPRGVRPDGGNGDDAGVPLVLDGGRIGDAGVLDGGRLDDAGVLDGGATSPLRVLLFSKTTGFRHASIPDAIAGLSDAGWIVTATEDAATFTDATLDGIDVVVFLLTTGDVLDDAQQGACERFIARGGGFVGVHSASDTEYAWPWYGALVGAYFAGHPPVQQASVIVEAADHPATAHLTSPWVRTDEWYAFQANPRAAVTVLLSLDETSYAPAATAMGDHPIAWAHESDGGRAFYTALGHTTESWSEAAFLQHVRGGVEWAGRRR